MKKRLVAVVCIAVCLLSCVISYADPVYDHTVPITIPGNKLNYGPSTYFRRPGSTGSQRWHCYLKQMDYDVDIGGGYPYSGNDIAVSVYSRTVDAQISGKKVMTGIGASYNDPNGYTFLSSAPLNNSSAEYKIVACKNNSSSQGVTACGLYCVFDWQPY